MRQNASHATMDYYYGWVRKHSRPRGCEFCDYHHKGRLDYSNHLQDLHPDHWERFRKCAGLKPARLSGTSKPNKKPENKPNTTSAGKNATPAPHTPPPPQKQPTT